MRIVPFDVLTSIRHYLSYEDASALFGTTHGNSDSAIVRLELLEDAKASRAYLDYLGDIAYEEYLQEDAQRAVDQYNMERYPETYQWGAQYNGGHIWDDSE